MIPLGIGQNLNYVVFFHVYKYMYLCYSCQNGLFYLWCMIVMNINCTLGVGELSAEGWTD